MLFAQKPFQQLAEHNILILYLCEGRNLNPLLEQEYSLLKESGLLDTPLNAVVLEKLLAAIPDLPPATYCPAPIAREIEQGVEFTIALAQKYAYDYIKVDSQQNWFLKGRHLDQRFKNFLQAYLFYEAPLKRYYVEYKVDQRMDKCYLACAITPMLALHIVENQNHQLAVTLNNGKQDQAALHSFRMDGQERLYCQTREHGEILLANDPRFFILEKITEDSQSLRFGKTVYPLSFESKHGNCK